MAHDGLDAIISAVNMNDSTSTDESVRSPSGQSTPGAPDRQHQSPSFRREERKRKRTSDSNRTKELGLMRDANLPRFIGSGSGIHFIRNVYMTLAKTSLNANHTASTPNNDLVPGEDDQLRNEGGLNRGEEELWNSEEISHDPSNRVSFEQLVSLTQSYFEIWHPVFPCIHAPSILEAFERIEQTGLDGLDSIDALIVRSIVSISLGDSRQTGGVIEPLPSSLVFMSSQNALEAATVALCQPTSFRITQAAVCVQIFLVSILRLNSAARLGGLIIRMAFNLGLHRCPARFPIFTKNERDLRKRLFWSIYALERFLCQALGLPLDIRDDDVDVCYPGEEHHARTPARTQNVSTEGDRHLRILKHVAKHAKIRGMILELRHKAVISRSDTMDRSSLVHAEIAKWSNEIQDAIDPDFSDIGDTTTDTQVPAGEIPLGSAHRLLLLVLKHESIIALNRPLMSINEGSHTYLGAVQNCISSARSIISAMSRHQAQHSLDATSLSLSVPIVWPSFTWALWMSCFILTYAAAESHFPTVTAIRCIRQSRQILGQIALRGTFWPGFCVQVLNELESALVAGQSECQTSQGRMASETSSTIHSQRPGTRAGSDHTHTTSPAHRATSSRNTEAHMPTLRASSPNSVLIDARRETSRTSRTPREQVVRQTMPGDYSRGLRLRQDFSFPSLGSQGRSDDAQPGNASAWHLTPGGIAAEDIRDPHSSASHLASGDGSIYIANEDIGDDEHMRSLLWYDQMFMDFFGSIDYPYLTASQLDNSSNPRANEPSLR